MFIRALLFTVLLALPFLMPHNAGAMETGAVEKSSQIAIERDFVSGRFGQIHVRIAKPAIASDHPPLVLFHPTPYSGDYFASFMRHMATDRIVIAIDTPGYGDSDRPNEPQSIPSYTGAISDALIALGYGPDGKGAVDVLGYHTGCLIATELAAAYPDMVRKLVLPGLPFFTGPDRQRLYDENAKADLIMSDGSHLTKKWEFAASAIDTGLKLERAQTHFNDLMQCYPQCWWAYHGVFTYSAEERFAAVTQPVLLITTAGSLKAETEAAAFFFPDAKLVHLEQITKGGFDLAPDQIAKATREFLNR